ncbi:MAG TPA: ferritin-like domain-containing protein [Polyangiaceae bacterium]|nr:ferritin-like domain-containing protein [Polyangiaceae bacterium]
MITSLRISPEIWRITLLSSLTGLGTVAFVACSSSTQSGTGANSTASGGSGGSMYAVNGGTTSTGGSTALTAGNGGTATGHGGGGSTVLTAGAGGMTTVATGGAVGMGGTGSGGSTPVGSCSTPVGVPTNFRCADSMPSASGPPGLETCANGLVHRAQATECPNPLPRDTVLTPPAADAGAIVQCHQDSDCTDAPHGYCEMQGAPPGPVIFVPGTFCGYGCVNDSECPEGSLCECGSPVGQCVQAQCKTDADCACDATCMRMETDNGCGIQVQYVCQTATDQCVSSADCNVTTTQVAIVGIPTCSPGLTGTTCSTAQLCAVGRPFLVQGENRTANIVQRGDWCAADLQPVIQFLTAEDSDVLARYWEQVGLMEHASIAAFARFALELLGQGAPAELLEATQRAIADETKHAKLAFALASRYAGKAMGPGVLDLTGAAPSSSLAQMVHTAIIEGAIGETVAAMEAAEALERAVDPAVRSVLSQIAHDESNHSKLAWEFLAWAIRRDPSLKATIAQAFDNLRRTPKSVLTLGIEHNEHLTQHGMLPEIVRRELRSRAISEVILPCAAALLGSSALPKAA